MTQHITSCPVCSAQMFAVKQKVARLFFFQYGGYEEEDAGAVCSNGKCPAGERCWCAAGWVSVDADSPPVYNPWEAHGVHLKPVPYLVCAEGHKGKWAHLDPEAAASQLELAFDD